jgi:hypothetical protein
MRTDRARPSAGRLIDASRFVNADGATWRWTAPEQNLVDRIRGGLVYGRTPREMRDNSL